MRSRWTGRRVIAISLGGALGAAARWALLVWIGASGSMPWSVLGVNVAGSVLLGVVLAEEWTHPRARLLLHDGAAIGFCGGLTTFSTFTVEVVDLIRDGHRGTAAAYGALSICLSILGVVAGAAALRQVRAIVLPVEEL